jgi:hypothetical protein
MTANRLILPFLCACCVFVFTPQAASQPPCETVKQIESINKGVLDKRVAHVKGINARLFIALDPIWSTPDFENVPYRHPEDMEMIERKFEYLMEQGIDEIIVWKFRRGGLAGAVPFKDGCAVSGYGEPDLLEKLIIMHKTLLLISKHGVDDSSVRDSIKRLLMVGRFARHFDDEMIDIIIDKLRPLMTNTKSSTNNN